MEFLNTISNNRVWNRHGVKVAWAAAGLCLLIAFVAVAWDARTKSKIKSVNYAKQDIAPIRKRQTETYQVSTIIRANLFGDATPAPVQRVVKQTNLNLKLQGLLWSTDDKVARAIIVSGNKKAELYSVGEEIKGSGASIQEIRDNEIILDRNGASESLALNKKFKSDKSLISYSNDDDAFARSSAQSASLNIEQSGQRTNAAPKPTSNDSSSRKVRKPNFSGLDRALKKMDEI